MKPESVLSGISQLTHISYIRPGFKDTVPSFLSSPADERRQGPSLRSFPPEDPELSQTD